MTHTRTVLLSLALGATLTSTSESPALASGLASSPWPMFSHDAQHTGRTDVNGPQGPAPQIVWQAATRSRLRAAVSVGEDGTIYVPNGNNPISAFDPADGSEIWASSNHHGGLADHSQPAVSNDGVVYQGARDNDLWSVQQDDGSVNWRFHIERDGDITTPPTIASDGTIYMGSEALGAGFFYAMNPDGTPKWLNILHGSLKNASPTLSHDESVVFVSIKTQAIAIDTDTGLEIWRTEIADKGLGSLSPCYAAVLSDDGSAIYFPSKEGLWALDPTDGSVLWKFVPLNNELLKSAPVLGADGTLYVGASKKKSRHFYALDPADGSIVWKHTHTTGGEYVNSQAAVGADGKVYVGFGDILFAFDPAGDGLGGSKVLWQMLLPGKFQSGVVLGGDGVLYIGAGARLFKITD